MGVSRITLVGVTFILKLRCGESATLVGESETGGLLTGEYAVGAFSAGVNLTMGSLRGESCPGIMENRLLRRRVDRFIICCSSISTLVSTCSGEAGISYSISGCNSPIMAVSVVAFLGSIGQRVLCRFLGTYFNALAGYVGVASLSSPHVVAAISFSWAKIAAGKCPLVSFRNAALPEKKGKKETTYLAPKPVRPAGYIPHPERAEYYPISYRPTRAPSANSALASSAPLPATPAPPSSAGKLPGSGQRAYRRLASRSSVACVYQALVRPRCGPNSGTNSQTSGREEARRW